MTDVELGQQTRRRITRRLMPFLFGLYFIAYLDRVNVSFAALEMTKELGMTHAAFGFGAGVFFLGYFLLEIPGALLVEVWSARKWIARIMISWGLVAAGTGLVTSAEQFYWLRFFLGMAEAGFFPGMLVYLSHWYRAEDRAKAVAMFMIAIPVSEIIGAPVSAFLMRIDWLGMAGWRWLLILEGLPAVVLGIVTLFYLTDWPRDAKWLTPQQRDWINGEIERDRERHDARHSMRVWAGLTNPRVFLLMFAYFAMMNLNYALVMWLPKILHSLAENSTFTTTLLTAVPFTIGAPFALWIGWHSDRLKERRYHAAVPLLCGAVALSLFPWAVGRAIGFALVLFAIAFIGSQSAKGPFWAIATTLLAGRAAATSIGLINSFGNLGGFVGPYTVGWLATRTGGFTASVLFIALAATAASGLILLAGRVARTAARPQPEGAAAAR